MRLEYFGETHVGKHDGGMFVYCKNENTDTVSEYVDWFCKEWELIRGYDGKNFMNPNEHYFSLIGIPSKNLFSIVAEGFRMNSKAMGVSRNS